MTDIAFLGLGAMGAPMASRLLDAGHRVVVYNRTAERRTPLAAAGAAVADSPRAAAAGADVVIAMLRDDGASRAVWLDAEEGAAGGLREGAVAMEASTLTPRFAGELGRAIEARGAAFLETPVVGSRPQAAAGALIFLVGGEAAALETARDVLAPLAGAIHHVGGRGAGMSMKLAVNALFGAQAAAVAEILGFLAKSGLATGRAAEILSALPVASPAAARIAGLVAAREFAPNFPIALVEKDFGYAVEAARAVGADLPTAGAVGAVFAEARRAGHGEDDIAAVARLFV